MRILNQKHNQLLNQVRSALIDLQASLIPHGLESEDEKILQDSLRSLDDLFMLVVVGEYNSGKSAFINALLGKRYLTEGVIPTTTNIDILRYGEKPEQIAIDLNIKQLSLPVDWLAEISIVDTPGTNAIIRDHETITEDFIPKSDLVLFITSADRSLTESERTFLEKIRDWGKKIIFVINKIDILKSRNDLDEIESFIAENVKALLGITPPIFPVSSLLAMQAKSGKPELLKASYFPPLEKYIHDSLDEKERIKLKLLNPVGVADRINGKYSYIIDSRLDLLVEDRSLLSNIEHQLHIYQQDIGRDSGLRLKEIENILLEMEKRGRDYFDEHFRLKQILHLVDKKKIEKEFQEHVIGNAPEQIEKKVDDMIDWLVESNLQVWMSVINHLSERERIHQDKIIGEIKLGSFHHERQKLLEAVGNSAQRVINSYDRDREAKAIAENAQNAVAASAALEVGAIGLGTIVTILATTAAADITGIVLASLIAVLGLVVIPAKRRLAIKQMRDKITILKDRLIGSLTNHLDQELNRSIQNINDSISPYSRFVRAESENYKRAKDAIHECQIKLNELKTRIEEI